MGALLLLRSTFQSPPKPAPCAGCNLIIITADALRADHLGCYGYGRNTTPQIDRFSKRALLFSNAVTPSPRTTSSLATMLTGLHPSRTGVRNVYNALSQQVTSTLPELLKQAGYTTAAVISNWVLKPAYSNLDRGFKYYDVEMRVPELNRSDVFERNAEQTVDASIKWLELHKDKRFFFWVHFIEPHGPYYPPPNYRGRFSHEGQKLVPHQQIPEYQRLPAIPVKNGSTDILSYVDAYDDEIFYLDEQLGRFFRYIEDKGLLESSVVIFASDHGESLGDHKIHLEHGLEVFDDSARIPLLIYAPPNSGLITGRTDVLTSMADIYSTALELLGIHKKQEPQRGFSLLAPLNGEPGLRSVEYIEDCQLTQFSARDTNAKIIRYNQQQLARFECYDLTSDPQEQNPNGCTTNKYRSLSSALDQFMTAAAVLAVPTVVIDPSSDTDIKALESLGYL
jgi:arylsulfatase A-like enzyme